MASYGNTLWHLPGRERALELGALALIVVLAATFRFWRLDVLPPGLHYDEAFNNLYALRIFRGEIRPIFIPENSGEEPLHIYLTALLFAVAGPTPLGGRIVSAAAGVSTALFTYLVAVELFRHLGRREAGRVGLLASLFLASWYWAFHYSRVGMEPSMVPVVSAIAVYFVWRAVRTGRKRDAILAGAFSALGLYTYPAGRTVPIVVALVVFYRAAFVRDPDRRLIPRLWLGLATAGVVAIPLATFFVQNPHWFLLRLQETSALDSASTSLPRSLAQGIVNVFLGLFLQGDANWRQNLPGRPMFDPAQLAIFAVGAAVCARQVKAGPRWFLLLWAAIGLLPTAFSEYAPHFGRALGAGPPMAIIAGVGMWAAGRYVLRRLPAAVGPAMRLTLAAGCVGIPSAFSAGLSLNDYFNRWARSPQLFIAFDVGLRAIGEYAGRLPASDTIYLSPVPSDWYTLTFAVGDDRRRLRSFNGRECLVFPHRTRNTSHHIVIVWPNEDRRSLPRLESLFPAGSAVWQVRNRDRLYAVDYAVPAGQAAQHRPSRMLRAQFGDSIALLGYDVSDTTVRAGGRIRITLWWQATGYTPADYTVSVQLIGGGHSPSSQKLWAQRDARPCDNSFPTTRWQPGEVIGDDYRMALPTAMPPGDYFVQVGIYELATGQRAAAQSADAPVVGNAVVLTRIRVTSASRLMGSIIHLQPGHAHDQPFD